MSEKKAGMSFKQEVFREFEKALMETVMTEILKKEVDAILSVKPEVVVVYQD